MFNQELATLLKAGMPLVQSLDILRRRVANPVFKAVLDDVHERVRAGTALSDAFAAHGDLFPGVYTASLMAGERSGSLETVLRRYVAYEKVVGDACRRKTISALIYPAILVSSMIVLVSIIVLKVVPAFSDFYASFDAELPLVDAHHRRRFELRRARYPVAAAGGAGRRRRRSSCWLRQPGQRRRLDRLLLRLPWVGRRRAEVRDAQLARTLATLLGGGIPLVNALEIAARSIGNRYMARELERSAQRVREGQSFAGACERRGVFPDVAVKMVKWASRRARCRRC